MYDIYMFDGNIEFIGYYLCKGSFVVLIMRVSICVNVNYIGWLYLNLIYFKKFGMSIQGIYYSRRSDIISFNVSGEVNIQ